VPSGEQTGLKLLLPGGFEIREAITTTVILDFDVLAGDLHFAPGKGWMLTPVVQLVEEAIILAVTSPALFKTSSRPPSRSARSSPRSVPCFAATGSAGSSASS